MVLIAMEVFNEQRRSERFDLRCLVIFAEEQGWSKDISATGMYFSIQQNLSEQERIYLTINLNKESVIRCEGKVVRIEKQPNGYGVAIQFNNLLFGK